MHAYLTEKHKSHIRLVDCPEPQRVVEVVSFVSKRRPTFAQRAVNARIISSTGDVDAIQYYRDFCSTLLQLWQAAIKTDADLRLRAFAVRTTLQQRSVRHCLMKWVLLTPKTSYRRVVWMVKAERRAHDAYQHRRMLLQEYRHVTRDRNRQEEMERKIQVGTFDSFLHILCGIFIVMHGKCCDHSVCQMV